MATAEAATPTRVVAIDSPRLALFTVVSTLLFLGLAVLGWGGFSFFSHPARTVLVIATLGLAGVALFSGGNLSELSEIAGQLAGMGARLGLRSACCSQRS